MNKIYTLLFCAFGFLNANGQTQTDTVANISVDSIQKELSDYKNLVNETEAKSKRDSLKKVELQQQISLLQERDKYKQAELLRQIQEIEAKDSLRDFSRKEKVLAMKSKATAYPVAPFSDTLFSIYLKIGPVLPAERAASISNKIKVLYNNDFFKTDSLIYMSSESTVDILFRDMIVMSITDWDALWMNQTKEELASNYTKYIQVAVDKERSENSIQNILIRSGLTVLIIFIVWLFIFFLNNVSKKVDLWIIVRRESIFKGIKLKDYEFLPPGRQLEVVLKGINLIKWVVFALLFYLSLPAIFSIFPFTKGWAGTLFDWIWQPAKDILLAFWNYLPNLFTIIVTFVITRYVVKFFKFLSKEIESGRLKLAGFHPDWAMPTFNIVRFLLFAFMFVVIFKYLPGSDSPIFQGVSVFLGILVSLGSSSAISNAIAGLVITYMRPYQIGNRVKIGEISGEVVEKSLLVTRIKTIKNEYITVPNAGILTGHTINYSTAKENKEGIILHTVVTIGYDVPWRKVHELLITAANDTKGVSEAKDPFVLQKSLDDFYVSYEINVYTKTPEKMAIIYSELHQNIQDQFTKAEIEILSPHYRAERDGSATTIPTSDT